MRKIGFQAGDIGEDQAEMVSSKANYLRVRGYTNLFAQICCRPYTQWEEEQTFV
jgi:hypothetical protein